MAPLEHDANAAAADSRWSGLQTRAISAALLAALVLAALWQGGWIFILLIVIAALLGIREWDGLTFKEGSHCKILGLFYIGIPCASLIWLRSHAAGMQLILYVILTVCATDIGAYFAGRKIGGPKLAPRISPGKTWAGLGGGIVAAAVAGAACSAFTPYPPSFIACMDLGAALALVAQGGDLLESWLKRRAGVKDSGELIPGHGGLLDRIDGYIFTLPFFALLVHLGNIL